LENRRFWLIIAIILILAVAATPLIARFLYMEPEMEFTDVIIENDGNLHVNDTVWFSFSASGMNVRDDRIHITSTMTVTVYENNSGPPHKIINERKIADIDIEVQKRNPTVDISANFTADNPGRCMIELSIIDWMRPKWREDSGPRQAFVYAETTVT